MKASVSRRIWVYLDEPHTLAEIEAHIGRRLHKEIRSARSNGYISKPTGVHFVRGPNMPGEQLERRGKYSDRPSPPGQYTPAQLSDTRALVGRIARSVFDLGGVL